jgi:hypothetical protein
MTEHLSRKKYKNYKSFILSQVIKPLSFQIYTKIDRFFLLAFNLKSDSFFSSQSSLIQHKSDNILFLSDFSFFLQKIILFNFHSFSNYLFSFKQNSLHSLDSSFLTNTKILNFFYNSCSASSENGASSALSSPSLTPCSENASSSASSPTFSYFSDKHLFSLTNLLRPFHTYLSHSYFFKIIPQSFRLFLTDLFFFFFQQKIEHFSTLRYISHILFLRTDYVLFDQTQQVFFQSKEPNKSLFHFSNNILSYCLKPLTVSNVYDSPFLFDQNFKRNSFYLSKVKDISKPLLYFGFDSSLSTDSKSFNSSSKTKDSSDSLDNSLPLQKSISSFQIHTGPRVLIQKSCLNNHVKIE